MLLLLSSELSSNPVLSKRGATRVYFNYNYIKNTVVLVTFPVPNSHMWLLHS